MTSSTHEADLKGNMFKRPIQTKFNCHGVWYGGRQDKPKKAHCENEHIPYTNIQCFSFPSAGISLKFHCWDWDLAKNQARKWDLGKIWAGKWDLYPSSGPSKYFFLVSKTIIPSKPKNIPTINIIIILEMLFARNVLFK